MNKSQHISIWLLVLSAILVSILFNFRILNFWFEIIEEQQLRALTKEQHLKLFWGFFFAGFHFFIFSVLAIFNYVFITKSYLQHFSVVYVVGCIVLGNVLFYLGICYIQGLFANSHLGIKGQYLTYDYFLVSNLSIATLAIAEAYILIMFGKVRDSAFENSRLREEKMQAELTALKDQIGPHFFFNTLSSLSAIIRNEEKEVGLEFVQEMSQTYRYTLASGQRTLVYVREELDFLHSYIFLLKKRFGDKLYVEFDISSEIFERLIPPMALQLLIENAIHHNIITQKNPLKIYIYEQEDAIVVRNNLQNKPSTESLGIGLKNLSNRYELLAQKTIHIRKDEQEFIVSLPLL